MMELMSVPTSERTLSVARQSTRAGTATTAIMAGTLAAHSWAGGVLPSVPWLVATCALLYAATRAVFVGKFSPRVMVIALGMAQFGLHALMTSLAGQSVQHAHHALAGSTESVVGPNLLSMSWQMAAAHTLSAVLTVAVWSVSAKAVAALLLLPDRPHLAVSVRRDRLHCAVAFVLRPVAEWRSGAPRRGPPRSLSPRCA